MNIPMWCEKRFSSLPEKGAKFMLMVWIANTEKTSGSVAQP
jgi:hypothetical protein